MNADGSYGPDLTQDAAYIHCTSIAPVSGSPGMYTVSITAGQLTTASASQTPRVITAALVGVPIVCLLGLLPAVRRKRITLLRYLGLALLAFAAMHTIACSSGGFTRPATPPTQLGSYVINIVSTPTTGAPSNVAVVQLVIGQ